MHFLVDRRNMDAAENEQDFHLTRPAEDFISRNSKNGYLEACDRFSILQSSWTITNLLHLMIISGLRFSCSRGTGPSTLQFPGRRKAALVSSLAGTTVHSPFVHTRSHQILVCRDWNGKCPAAALSFVACRCTAF